MNFIKDFLTIIKIFFSRKEKVYFVENNKLIQYLFFYIKEDIEKNIPVIIVCFDDILKEFSNYRKNFTLKTSFFKQIFFLTIKTKYLISTTPDLGSTIFQKSLISKVQYIYIQHSPCSLTHIYNKNAFINFDIIEAVNKQQYSEILRINEIYGKKIQSIKTNYKLFSKKIDKSKNIEYVKNFLIAPTWHTNFYTNNNLEKIISIIKEKNYKYIFRPHYMSLKKKEITKEYMDDKKINYDIKNYLNFDDYTDLISDWSGIFIEFSYFKKKFSVLVNTKQKILNPEYKKFNPPIEMIAREQITLN